MATLSAFQNVRYTADKGKTNVVSAHGMTAYEGVELQLHSFLTKALDRGKNSVSRPGLLNLRETVFDSYRIGGWVDSEPVWTF
jgi:hypothetical protein